MTLANSYYAALKNTARNIFGIGDAQDRNGDKQKIEATRMVCRETLDALLNGQRLVTHTR